MTIAEPQRDLRITLAETVGYGRAARPDYRFAVNCFWRHASGAFGYSATTWTSALRDAKDSPWNFTACNRV